MSLKDENILAFEMALSASNIIESSTRQMHWMHWNEIMMLLYCENAIDLVLPKPEHKNNSRMLCAVRNSLTYFTFKIHSIIHNNDRIVDGIHKNAKLKLSQFGLCWFNFRGENSLFHWFLTSSLVYIFSPDVFAKPDKSFGEIKNNRKKVASNKTNKFVCFGNESNTRNSGLEVRACDIFQWNGVDAYRAIAYRLSAWTWFPHIHDWMLICLLSSSSFFFAHKLSV